MKQSDIVDLFRIILLGDSGCGKTSLLLRFAENIFNPHQGCTIGVDFKMKHIKVDDSTFKLMIWDTAGQERYRSVSVAYLRNADACIAVYDITRRQTFLSLEKQITDFLNYADKMGLNHDLHAKNNGLDFRNKANHGRTNSQAKVRARPGRKSAAPRET